MCARGWISRYQPRSARRSGAGGRPRPSLSHRVGAGAGQLAFVSLRAGPTVRLQDVAQEPLEQVITTRGRAKLQAAMAACDDLAAAQVARGLREMVQLDQARDSPHLRLPWRKRCGRFSTGCWPNLRNAACLQKTQPATSNSVLSQWRTRPGDVAIVRLEASRASPRRSALCGKLCGIWSHPPRRKGCCADSVRGPGAELLDHFYGDGLFTSHWMAAIQPLSCRRPRATSPRGADFASWKLGRARADWRRTCCRYSIAACTPTPSPTCPRPSSPGQSKSWRPSPRWSSKFWISKSRELEQGFEPDAFDFIVGTNVLHAVATCVLHCGTFMNF